MSEAPSSTSSERYSYDNSWDRARDRLGSLEARFDPGTIRHLEATGVREGWRCLEIGAGGGTVAAWLAARVGPTGHVVATDLDTRFLDTLGLPNLEVRRHDIGADPLPSDEFDLIHARLVLSHVPTRELALRTMAGALKPGGKLLCEEDDWISSTLVSPSDAASVALYAKVDGAIRDLMSARGHVADLGRRLYGLFRDVGLIAIGAEGRLLLRYAGPGAETARLTVLQLSSEIVSSGLATAAEIDAYVRLIDDPLFVALPLTVMAVWGTRPPT